MFTSCKTVGISFCLVVYPLFLMSSTIANPPFKRYIDGHLNLTLNISRNSHAHEEARELVPIADIVQENEDILEGDFHDKFLPHLVKWFSNDFFKWFNAPECQKCAASTKLYENFTDAERRNVERYACAHAPTCNFTCDFIRHNDPSILLHTRTGRCGEWAICFYVFLRALDYDTRIVYDYTDHVWNEVYSKTQEKWIHVDPCESTIDAPLLYEVGWGKKLDYCIAFSQFEVTDVTRRYVIDYEETKDNRHECDESWLDQYLHQTTYDLLRYQNAEQMKKTILRRMRDIEYLKQLSSNPRPIPDKSELSGRKTGSLAWRIERGEYCISLKNSYVINVTQAESYVPKSDEELFFLHYDCDKDIYYSSHPDLNDKKNWSVLTYEYDNVDHKYEKDWETSYLARYEGCPVDKVGKITWRFDISKLDHFDRVVIKFLCDLYPETRVDLTWTSYSLSEDKLLESPIAPNVMHTLKREQLGSGPKFFELSAILSGGHLDDEVAWQKPQLFRQERSSYPGYDHLPFSIIFY